MTNLFSIVIEDKINAKSKLVYVNKLIIEKRYEEAVDILNDINISLANTEFVSFVNYYLSLIEFDRNNLYKALYFIENAINDSKFYLVSKENQVKMRLHQANLYYKLEFFEKALEIFKSIKDYSIVYKDQINLYIAEIYFRRMNDIKRASYYFKDIDINKLDQQLKDLYYYLENFLLWTNIDTSNINYKDPNVNSLLIDKDILYIGLWNGGLIKYNYILEEYDIIPLFNYASEEVRALFTDNRRIYVGTTNGVAIIDKRNYNIKNETALKNVSITCIEGDENFVYYGTLGNGLICYDRKDNEFYQIIDNENISTLYFYGSSLYIGTYNGNIYKYENNLLNRLIEFSFINTSITDFIIDNNNLWITTHGQGIILYNLITKKIKKYSTKTGDIPDDFILCSEIKDDKIYFGTLGNGIIFFDKNVNRWKRFKISDMYITSEIKSIKFSLDYMFIGTLGNGVLQKLLIQRED